MKTTDFKEGDRVAYKARHEATLIWGTVSSVNDTYVFVRFDEQVSKLGWHGTTSQACTPKQLVKEES